MTKILNIIISFIFILKSIFCVFYNKTMCNHLAYCDTCYKCGNDTQNFTKCNYTNLFCKSKTNQLVYFPKLLRKYIYNFRVAQETRKYCGRPEILFNRNQKSIELNFGKNIGSYLFNGSLHCNYIRFTDFFPFFDYEITFELLKNKNFPLSFDIILSYRAKTKSGIEFLSDSEIRNNQKKLTLNKASNFMILIDFHKKKGPINETLKIKINSLTKNLLTFPRGIYLHLLFGIIPLLLLFIVPAILFIHLKNRILMRYSHFPSLYFRTNNFRRLNQANSNENEQIENINKLKINNLFKTILAPKIFHQNDIINDCVCCTICLENFEDKKSIISITACNHIFHYDCLKKWADENIQSFNCPICKKDLIGEENINEGDNRIVYNFERRQELETDSVIDLLNFNNFV